MGIKSSSRRWLDEHFNDYYVKKAQKEGYRSRSAYKLLELNERDHLIQAGMKAVDLGAAPGGWTEVLARLVGPKGEVFALDILPMDPIAGVHVIQGDFTQESVFEQLLSQLNQQPIDLVISDMAPNISGIRGIDQPRAMYLAELALDFAIKVLKSEGCFLVKVFQGEGFDEYLKTLRQSFQQVKIRKPKSSRSRSNEVYLLARGFKA